jgi:cation-transporting P-type ATPase C
MKGQNATDIVVGRGVRAELDGNAIIVGNKGFMEAENVNPAFFNGKAQDYLKKGCTVIYVARNGELQGMIAVADTLRPGAVNLVNLLHAKGVPDIHLISGDMEPVVKSLAEALKFDCYQAELLPEAKAAYVEKLKAEGKKVLMIGDGVNDALALAKASVGIAMGHGGAEVALEAADIALLKDNLTELLFLRALSQKTMNTIEANFWIATTTNIFGILLGATGWLSPVMAGALHVVHTAAIMMNSGRLMGWNKT